MKPQERDKKEKQGRKSGPVRQSKGKWTPEEDEVLRKAVERYKGKKWQKIAECFKDRTSIQCLHRWHKVLKPDLVKGPWSKEEDNKLISLVEQYGTNWATISKHLHGRIGKQCRERWINQLNPEINRNEWTQEEDLTLIHAHRIFGNQWAELMKFLPGRSDNSIKNHWNSSVKKNLDSYIASGLLDECESSSLISLQDKSIAASSSSMHSSGDEGNSRPEVDAEESGCSQASTVFSKSTNDLLDELNPGNEKLYMPRFHSGAEQQISNAASHAEPCNPSSEVANLEMSCEADCLKKFQNLNCSHEVRTTTATDDQLQVVSNDAKLDLDQDLLTHTMDDGGKNQALQSLVRLGDQPSLPNSDTDPETQTLFTEEEWNMFLQPSSSEGLAGDSCVPLLDSSCHPFGATEIEHKTDTNEGFIETAAHLASHGNNDDDGISEQQNLSCIAMESLKLVPLNSFSSPSKIYFPIDDKPAEKDKGVLCNDPPRFPSADRSPFYFCDLIPSKGPDVTKLFANYLMDFPGGNTDINVSSCLDDSDSFPTIRTTHYDTSPAASDPLLTINSDPLPELYVPCEDIVKMNKRTSSVEGSLVEKKEDSFLINTDSSSSRRQFRSSSPVSVLKRSSLSSQTTNTTSLILPQNSGRPQKKMINTEEKTAKITSSSRIDLEFSGNNVNSYSSDQNPVRKCMHCEATKTPQWRHGPMGPGTLCNACGLPYISGRLYPEQRLAASPTSTPALHSDSHKKVAENEEQEMQ